MNCIKISKNYKDIIKFNNKNQKLIKIKIKIMKLSHKQ
jgi:hypothetical protein